MALPWSEEQPVAAESCSQPPDPKHMASARLPRGGLRPEIPETGGKVRLPPPLERAGQGTFTGGSHPFTLLYYSLPTLPSLIQ